LNGVLTEEFSKEKKDVTLPMVLEDENMQEAFRKQLVHELSHENLQLWKEVRKLIATSDSIMKRQHAQKILLEYMDIDSQYQMNFNQSTIFAFRDAVLHDNALLMDNSILQRLLSETEFLMLDSFKRFKENPTLKVLLNKKQHRKSNFNDVVGFE